MLSSVDICFNPVSLLINLHHLQLMGLVQEIFIIGSSSSDRNVNTYLKDHWMVLNRRNRLHIYFFGLEIKV